MKRRWIWFALAALNAALLARYVWGIAEGIVPVHYGIDGQADRFGSKWLLLIPAAVPLLLLGLYEWYRYHFRDHPRIAANRKYEDRTIPLIAMLFVLVGWLMVAGRAQRLDARVPSFLAMGLGMLIVFISNLMGKIQPNRTFGYKLPWTLRDDEVWRRTHRVAGYCGVVGGLLFILSGVLGFWLGPVYPIIGILLGLVVMTIPPAVYAYRLYHRLHPR